MSAAPAPSRLSQAALGYAARGWSVFPLRPREKQPLVPRGFLSATTDSVQVSAWWAEHPQANIGLWPGQSGLLVIDVDGPEGEDTARALGILAEPTLVCTTGRADGGRHLYFNRPPWSVSNCSLGPKLDVRGDAGYVILPPSVHPSGRLYGWIGRAEEICDLPPVVLARLKAAQTGASPPPGGPARDIAFEDTISQGGRNNALTRYAGRLLAKGIPPDESLVLVAAVNETRCTPPLPQSEVNQLVASIANREAGKRMTGGGTTLSLVDQPAQGDADLPRPRELARGQVEEVRELLHRDVSGAPRWAWSVLDKLTGPMIPGDLVVIGSLMGNGKSTVLMSQMDAFAERGTPTLYLPLEVDPAVCRLRWAAWKLDLDVRHVIRQDWAQLPEHSRETVESLLDDQERNPFVHFAPPKRITLHRMVEWCEWAKREVGCRVVMLDHLHRMDFGSDAAGYRVAVTEVVRRLKDVARDLDLVVIAAAQLNRSPDPIDKFTQPQLSRLKESAGIAEEADVVLMLSRRLKESMPDKWHHRLRTGDLQEWQLAEPGTMVVTCRKHRLDDTAVDRRAFLEVINGRVRDRTYSWEREQGEWSP